MRISAILIFIAFPLSADTMTIRIRDTECNHVDITNQKTGETETIHLSDITSDEPTEDLFIQWARKSISDASVDRKRVTKDTVKTTLEGKVFTPIGVAEEPIKEEPIFEEVRPR